jgi:hypothetical protein
MVHNDGPQCTDTIAVAAREVTAGKRFLICDASLGSNPSLEPNAQPVKVRYARMGSLLFCLRCDCGPEPGMSGACRAGWPTGLLDEVRGPSRPTVC